MKILVIAPHMDDEVLGMGGTIARHVSEEDEVYVCFIAHRIYDHKFNDEKNKIEVQCALKAKKVLGYKEAEFFNLNDERLDVSIQDILIPLEQYVNKIKPETVYVTHRGDNHQDHRAVFQAAMIALRPFANLGIKKILSYETPSSTEQSPNLSELAFLPNFYINIEKYLETKIKALRCYQTEKRDFPHPRSDKSVEILAIKRGTEVGFKAAEAFVVIRDKWN
ncbi:MAG: PIG-L deacetylase family protein [Candidatus Altiarchaeota archaeon]